MCYYKGEKGESEKAEKRFFAKSMKMHKAARLKRFMASGFTFPEWPVIASSDPTVIDFFHWGLIPSFTEDESAAKNIREYTLNAVSETIRERKSYQHLIDSQRCIILLSHFYEWREVNGKKYPYLIRVKSDDVFAVAGLWDEWVNPKTGEIIKSYTLITCEANPLMATIHNRKKRMPVILGNGQWQEWLKTDLTSSDVDALMKPFPEENMEAFTISKLITSRKQDPNVPEVMKPYDYPELGSTQSRLFD